ncbi:MAG: hypothetical protein RL220_1110 [Bacteroidota bacterium]|jgi:ADP-heptose:LPS heptosyltransferase
MKAQTIIISRTDSIGDVVLTLPMCGLIKRQSPETKIIFLGRSYTEPIVMASSMVDAFINWDEMKDKSPSQQVDILKQAGADAIIHVFPRREIIWIAKKAAIPVRIATGGRWYTLTKCNKLVFFSRKRSHLHEAQLNMKLLEPLGIHEIPALDVIPELYGFTKVSQLDAGFLSLIDTERKTVVLHPKSRGSAVEWGPENFRDLVNRLSPAEYQVFVTGTSEEQKWVKERITWPDGVIDLSGQMSLDQLISFISRADILIAASTGPLHIASALGKKAIGLFSPKRPIHPGRWAPLGRNAIVICASQHPAEGQYLDISPDVVLKKIQEN